MKQQLAQELLRQLDKNSPEYVTAVKLIEAMNHKPRNDQYILSATIKDKFISATYILRMSRKAEYRIIWRRTFSGQVESVSVQNRQTKDIKRYYFSKEI